MTFNRFGSRVCDTIRPRPITRLDKVMLTVADTCYSEQTVTRMIVALLNVPEHKANVIRIGFHHAYTDQESRWHWYERQPDPDQENLGAYYLIGFEAGMKASLLRRDE